MGDGAMYRVGDVTLTPASGYHGYPVSTYAPTWNYTLSVPRTLTPNEQSFIVGIISTFIYGGKENSNDNSNS